MPQKYKPVLFEDRGLELQPVQLERRDRSGILLPRSQARKDGPRIARQKMLSCEKVPHGELHVELVTRATRSSTTYKDSGLPLHCTPDTTAHSRQGKKVRIQNLHDHKCG